jgi:lytic murein transglycosylase
MRAPLTALLLALAAPAAAQTPPCGGDFGAFVAGLKAEAARMGIDPAATERFFAGVRRDGRTISADRAQGVFQLDFTEFARRLISADRMRMAGTMEQRHAALLAEVERLYGVPRGILLAFWALETDFGRVQGDFRTIDSLVTLAHDCRRPELFRPQVLAALELYALGGMDLSTTGAWAGEIGQVQMLPGDILALGMDGDGDGRVDLKGSVADALHSGGAMLRALGWRPGEPWLVEVDVPAGHPWRESGLDATRPAGEWLAQGIAPRYAPPTGPIPPDLPAALIAPQGADGPVFLGFDNFTTLFEWNQSFVYVATAAYFATRIMGAPVFDADGAPPGLGEAEMLELQRRLTARGHDVGEVDGILGRLTRAAVRAEQRRLGLRADGFPTRDLLGAL